MPEDDPSPSTRWVMAHPVQWGVRSGLASSFAAMASFRHLGLAVASSVVLGALDAWIRRPGGPGIRWRRQVLLHEEQEQRPCWWRVAPWPGAVVSAHQ